MTGGPLMQLSFADYKRRRIQCGRCEYLFQQPPLPRSPLGKFARWIVVVTLIPIGLAALLYLSPELAELLPPVPALAPVEAAIAADPRIALYLVLVLVIAIPLSCGIAACVGNAKYPQKLATEYLLKPLSSRQFASLRTVQPDAVKPSSNA
jgi:hypothetical protein